MNLPSFSALSSIYHQHQLNPQFRPQKPSGTESSQKLENKPPVNNTERPDGAAKPNNTSSLPDQVFADIQEMAKKDAKKEDYMSPDSYGAYLKKYKTQNHISPDRGQLITMFNPMVQTTPGSPNGEPIFINKIPGFPSYSAKFTPNSVMGGTMSVYDESGDPILSYTPPTHSAKGGWKEIPTKKEAEFQKEADRIYKEAYDAARKELTNKKAVPLVDVNLSV